MEKSLFQEFFQYNSLGRFSPLSCIHAEVSSHEEFKLCTAAAGSTQKKKNYENNINIVQANAGVLPFSHEFTFQFPEFGRPSHFSIIYDVLNCKNPGVLIIGTDYILCAADRDKCHTYSLENSNLPLKF